MDEDRKQFNAWLEATFDSDAEFDFARNCYKEASVHMAWMGWRAALQALRRAELVGEVDIRDSALQGHMRGYLIASFVPSPQAPRGQYKVYASPITPPEAEGR